MEFRRLQQSIGEFGVVPVASTCEVEKWLDHPFLCFYSKRDADYQRAVNYRERMYARWNHSQIVDYLSHLSEPYFMARHDAHYYEVDYSVNLIERLLLFQYAFEDEVAAFLQRLFDICDRRLPKKNSMYIEGEACSGKTYFADMLAAFYLNPGYVANFVRGENFPLNDCVNRRLLIWNEPSIAPSCFDDVKMLAGGDPLPTKVKYQNNAVVLRTPLLFTANTRIFDDKDEIWSSRIYFEKWNHAPLLMREKKYPHPLAWLGLLTKYKIK